MRTIFVHLTAYCDPELIPTIRDMFLRARHPEALRVGICWQHTPDDDSMEAFKSDPQFCIIDIPHNEARGCCYARARAQSLYNGEDYVLQLDSHQRFAPYWDETLIEMLHQTGVEKPALGSYAGSYKAETGINPCVPWIMRPLPFNKDGSIYFRAQPVKDWEARTKPVPARFASGHFFFTLGRHCAEVPYDPDLYFLGEELVMAARSYTHGYDLFHPHRLVIYHQFKREGRQKFWDDAPQKHRELDKISRARVLKLMEMEDNEHNLTTYGLGTERTLGDYERFAGMDFKGRRIHEDAILGLDPTGDYDSCRWMQQYRLLVCWSSKQITLPENCQFVRYTAESAQGKALWHNDARADERFQLKKPTVEFLSVEPPQRLTVQPRLSSGWGTKYILDLNKETLYSPA